MKTDVDENLLMAFAELTPRFAVSVACVSAHAGAMGPSAKAYGAAFTPIDRGVAPCAVDGDGPARDSVGFPAGGLYDCVLIGEGAESVLRNKGCLSDILGHLSRNGVVIALISSSYADAMSTELKAPLEEARLVRLRVMPIDEEWSAFAFARDTYDPPVYARQLAGAGMPGRAAAVLDWMETYAQLEGGPRSAIAIEKLRYFRQAVERATPAHTVLFHAQKEFHLAVHEWPRRVGPYLDQAGIWRRCGNDDYAARLLRSVHHVTDDAAAGEALEQCARESTPQPGAESLPEWTGTMRAPRVLVLTHDSSDYGMDTLYDGLCQVLGAENVVEYPWKPTLHGRNKDAAVGYPCWFDYPGRARSTDELTIELREGRFDLIVFADFVQMNKRDAVRRMLDAAPDVPVVAYDPWDDGGPSQDAAIEYLGGGPLAAYFKREMLACLDYGPNAYPLPFGYSDRHVPTTLPERRSTELFWAGKRLFGTRSLYLDRLAEVLGRSLDQTYSQEEYRAAIADARMGLSMFGFGFDTVRYWELAAHGCMVLAERPLVRIPFNFVEGESAVFWDDLPELERKLAYYLAHPDEAEAIGRAGRERFLRYHTSSARAKQFLGVIEKVVWGG